LREKYRLRVLANRMLKRTLKPKSKGVTEKCRRKLDELRNITAKTNSWEMGRA
jgi:hypothetical protein